MSDTNNTTGKPQDELVTQLGKLGENLGKMFKTAVNSEELKSVEREVRAGMEQMSKQVNQAMEAAKMDDTMKKAGDSVKKAGESVKGAWENARGPEFLEQVRLGFVDSLKKLNAEVERMTPRPAEEVKPDKETASDAPKAGDGI